MRLSILSGMGVMTWYNYQIALSLHPLSVPLPETTVVSAPSPPEALAPAAAAPAPQMDSLSRFDRQALQGTNPLKGEINLIGSGVSTSQVGGSTPESFSEVCAHYGRVYGIKFEKNQIRRATNTVVSEGNSEATLFREPGEGFARFIGSTGQYTYFTTVRENKKTHRILFDSVRASRANEIGES